MNKRATTAIREVLPLAIVGACALALGMATGHCYTGEHNMTLNEYKQRLATHDWFYMYSDDARVYAKGRDNYEDIMRLSFTSDEHRQAYLDACQLDNDQ